VNNILGLLNQLRKDWNALQIDISKVKTSINKVNETIIKLIGDEQEFTDSSLLMRSNEESQNLDYAERGNKWKLVLQVMKELNKRIKFLELMDELKKKGFISDIKTETAKIRSQITYLKTKKLIGKDENGYYFVIEENNNEDIEENRIP
jgi:hypothetical protein